MKSIKLNPKPSKLVALLAIIFGIFSCTFYPKTPSEVVGKFTEYMANGECDAAMNLCEGEARMVVQGNIDAGCDPYEATVDSVVCDITDNEATCLCYESREGYTGIQFPYKLKKINEQWKIVENTKDTDSPF